ncbi:hypothetical protein TSUD_204350 [Trifolium subterraneum]|uniref:Uncharacterized protein n=1 Tax=Trifolium subterraneum TaxID=3900 RepID=A0A2Z6P8P9_TRISU|nr:hypothetical protein TSUD_204350 [Trifolium subterraneum]
MPPPMPSVVVRRCQRIFQQLIPPLARIIFSMFNAPTTLRSSVCNTIGAIQLASASSVHLGVVCLFHPLDQCVWCFFGAIVVIWFKGVSEAIDITISTKLIG